MLHKQYGISIYQYIYISVKIEISQPAGCRDSELKVVHPIQGGAYEM